MSLAEMIPERGDMKKRGEGVGENLGRRRGKIGGLQTSQKRKFAFQTMSKTY